MKVNIDPSCEIGIFLRVNGELIFKSTAVYEVMPVEDIRDVKDDHFSFWEYMSASNRRDLAVYSYDHFPRGRIVYRDSDWKFIIYADRCLLANKEFFTRLRKAFGLVTCQCVIMSDSHYQCHECNPFFVSDSSVLGED